MRCNFLTKDTNENNNIEINRPAGFRDFFPEEYAKIQFILDTMKRVSREFGYEEYHSPAVELLKLYELKSGEDIIDETFKIESRSGQKLVLIPELTPSLTRMLAEKQLKYTKPIRWFSIPKCYRDETLQRGRVKEFWQYNIDILGVGEIYADAEIIAILVKIIKELGLSNQQFVVLVNDRYFIQKFLEELGITTFLPIFQIFDRKDKHFQEKIEKILSGAFSEQEANDIAITIRHAQEIDESIFEVIPETKATKAIINDFQNLRKEAIIEALKQANVSDENTEILYKLAELSGSPKSFLKKAKELYPGKDPKEALKNLEELTQYLEAFKITPNIEFDGSLARGLDYYTGIIFEAWSRQGVLPRAIAGGGRYGDLVAMLGGQKLTGTGLGFGETVILELLDEYNISYPKPTICDVYIAPIKLSNLSPAIELVTKLQKAGIKVIMNPFNWRIKRHFENAEKKEVRWMIIMGKRDLKKDSVTLRDIISGEQELVSIDKIINVLKKRLQ
jgi:histidyl-tRNA synthetase